LACVLLVMCWLAPDADKDANWTRMTSYTSTGTR
jgi:hypothetical protein